MADADPSTPTLGLTGDLLDPMRLWAVMCHPHDTIKQHELLDAYRAYVLYDIANQMDQDTVTVDRAMLRAVVDLPSLRELSVRAAEGMRGGLLAGELLLYVLSMRVAGIQEPSIRKALYLMEREKRISQPTLRKYFRDFRAVVHLWAAFVLTSPILESPGLADADDDDVAKLFFGMDVASFANTAEGLRQFAEMTILPRTNAPLIKPGTLYAAPSNYLVGGSTLEVDSGFLDKIRAELTAYASRHLP